MDEETSSTNGLPGRNRGSDESRQASSSSSSSASRTLPKKGVTFKSSCLGTLTFPPNIAVKEALDAEGREMASVGMKMAKQYIVRLLLFFLWYSVRRPLVARRCCLSTSCLFRGEFVPLLHHACITPARFIVVNQ